MSRLKEHLLLWIALILLGLALITLLYGINANLGHGQVMINCGVAEISPDFSPAIRDECRKLKRL